MGGAFREETSHILRVFDLTFFEGHRGQSVLTALPFNNGGTFCNRYSYSHQTWYICSPRWSLLRDQIVAPYDFWFGHQGALFENTKKIDFISCTSGEHMVCGPFHLSQTARILIQMIQDSFPAWRHDLETLCAKLMRFCAAVWVKPSLNENSERDRIPAKPILTTPPECGVVITMHHTALLSQPNICHVLFWPPGGSMWNRNCMIAPLIMFL